MPFYFVLLLFFCSACAMCTQSLLLLLFQRVSRCISWVRFDQQNCLWRVLCVFYARTWLQSAHSTKKMKRIAKKTKNNSGDRFVINIIMGGTFCLLKIDIKFNRFHSRLFEKVFLNKLPLMRRHLCRSSCKCSIPRCCQLRLRGASLVPKARSKDHKSTLLTPR